MHRRQLLKLGGASMAALAATKTFGQETGPGDSNFGFIIEPDSIARLDETTHQISHVSPVIVPEAFGKFLPALLTNHTASPEEAEAWFKSRFSSCCSDPSAPLNPNNPLDARASVPFLEEPFLGDVITHVTQHQGIMASSRRGVGRGAVQGQDEIALNIYSSTKSTDQLAVNQEQQGYRLTRETPTFKGGTEQPMAAYGSNIYTSPWLRVFMAYPETHPLIPCEYRNVYHVKFDMFLWPDCGWSWWGCQYRSGGYQISSLHIGSVTGQKCLVVFDSLHPWICVDTCNMTGLSFATVQNGIQRALAATPVPSWLIPTIAAILAGLVVSLGIVALA